MTRLAPRFTLALPLGALLFAAHPAWAAPPSPALMEKLATYGATFDQVRTRASYSISGRLDLLDGDGKVDSWQELLAHVDPNGGTPKVTVLRYLEDGKDKTADGIEKARVSDEKRKQKRKEGKELKMPVLPGEQGRYVFDQTEQSADGERVRITFVPKEPAEDTVEGSAWVDVEAGTVISATFKVSRTPMFVKYVHVWVEFGERTPLGPTVSKITLEGEGGILFFFHKHFRGTANLSGYSLAP